MFPALVGVDPATATYVRGGPGALALDWTVSEDNLVYTFTLRQDYFWSDGTPITANDLAYHWDLITDPAAQHPDAFLIDIISDVVALDDYTLEVTFPSPACTALGNASTIVPVPAHVYSQLPVEEIITSSEGSAPTVTGGVFRFGEFRPADQTTLLRDDNYVDAELGYVSPDAWIYRVVPDQTVQVEQILAGEINVLDGPPVNRRSDLRDSSDIQVYSYPGNSWDYMGMNLADPANPQPGFAEDGTRIDQGSHPVFGDPNVRLAVAHAVDVDAIIDGAVFGEGQRMTSAIIPQSWAYNTDLPAIEFDPDLADQLLTEAGWADSDGDGVREKDGVQLAFTLYTNQGNTRREAIGTIIQDQLAQIPNGGFAVDFQAIDFNTLLDIMDAQTFDAFILGWRNGYPDDPDLTQLFGAAADVPGSGFNFSSYYNEEFNALNDEALSLSGCDQGERAELYKQMQEIIQTELPYLWLFAIDGMYTARVEISGFDPYPSQLYWNVDTWAVATP
jgi:peptide/nickel transport system substrate-binding protein